MAEEKQQPASGHGCSASRAMSSVHRAKTATDVCCFSVIIWIETHRFRVSSTQLGAVLAGAHDGVHEEARMRSVNQR